MTPNEDFRNLTKVLADLYDKKTDLQRILEEAGIPLLKINLDASSLDRWHSALTEARKLEKIDILLSTIKNGEYGKTNNFLRVYNAYRQSMEDNSRGKLGNPQITKPDPDSLRDRILRFIKIITLLITIAATVVLFVNPAFFEIRSNLNHLFKMVGVPEVPSNVIINTVGITNTDGITTEGVNGASEINRKLPNDSKSLIGRIATVDPVTAWDTLCLRKSAVDGEVIRPCMPADEKVTLLSDDNNGWVQVKDQNGRQGYTLLRYLLFTEVQDTYVNLFWRYKNPDDKIDDDCITAPRLELLPFNQPENFCDPNVRVMSLDMLKLALRNEGMLDKNESIIPWSVDQGASIRVKTDDNSLGDFIKINKKYPKSSKKFLVGAIWREIPYPGTPIRKICWLKTNGELELVCDPVP